MYCPPIGLFRIWGIIAGLGGGENCSKKFRFTIKKMIESSNFFGMIFVGI